MDRRKFTKAVGIVAETTLLSVAGITKADELLNNKTDKKRIIVVLTGNPRWNRNSNAA